MVEFVVPVLFFSIARRTSFHFPDLCQYKLCVLGSKERRQRDFAEKLHNWIGVTKGFTKGTTGP